MTDANRPAKNRNMPRECCPQCGFMIGVRQCGPSHAPRINIARHKDWRGHDGSVTRSKWCAGSNYQVYP